MQINQSIDRQIPGFKLTITLSPSKLIIRALQKTTSDLFICQFINGQLRQDLKFHYENQDIFFDQLISPATALKIQKDKLIIPYTTFRCNRPIQREFVIGLIKVQANQIQTLKNKVAHLEEQAHKFTSIEQELKSYKFILDNLEKRSQIFHYKEGDIKSLILDQVNNPEYQIRLNYLRRKDVKKQKINGHMTVIKFNISTSLVSTQPLDFNSKLFSFKVKVNDTVQKEKSTVFIGLCCRTVPRPQIGFGDSNDKQQKFEFIVPKGMIRYEQPDVELQHLLLQTKNQKKTLCDLFYAEKILSYQAKKDDSFVLTVDTQNGYLTWYKNEVSLQRSYFQRPTTNVYPFIWMSPNTEVIF